MSSRRRIRCVVVRPTIAGFVVLAGMIGAALTSRAPPLVLQRTYLGDAELDQFGFCVGPAGDVDADGFADFLVGANVNDEAILSGGKIYLYLGGVDYPDSAVVTYAGNIERENVGAAVHGGADLNGDGYDDWVAGAPGLGSSGTDPGRVYVFWGGASPDGVPDLVIPGDLAGGQFGAAVCLVRDLDGDGTGDLVVGAPRAGDGRVYIYRGDPVSFDGVPERILHARPGDRRFGRALAWLPDDDADGRDDLLVGVPRSSQAATWAGAALLYRGTADLDSVPDLVLLGEAAGDEFGSSLFAGADLDADGEADVLVGAPAANPSSMVDAGKAYVFRAGPALDPIPDLILSGSVIGDRFGSAVAGGFDWDGDGAADLAVGAPDHDAGGAGAGACFVFLGGALLDAAADSTLLGSAAGVHLGRAVASAGDVRRNGRGTLLVGGYNASAAGRALLFGSDAVPTSAHLPQPGLRARLLPAWPNPFNPRVRTELHLDAPGFWVVDVFDARGRRVTRLWSGWLEPGRHPLHWNGTGLRGRPVASGVYRIRAAGPAAPRSRTVTLIR
ncbi:MAG: FlgD immunoglobulin-like domain containing protein [Candidatus Krumholzibacteriia bacterium]